MMDQKVQTVLDAIKNRRTIPWTRLTQTPIPEDIIKILLECANLAPSHKHTEPWRFTIFTGKGRERFARVLAETYKETAGAKFNEKKYEKAKKRPNHVPVVITVVMKASGLVPHFEEVLAVGCAVQNLHLAASAMGLGCAWSTPGYLDHPNIRKLLNLEENDSCMGFLYLGVPHDGEPLKWARKPIEEKITRITD